MDDVQIKDIRKNLDIVMEKVFNSARKCGREVGDIKIIVVSKGQSLEKVSAAIKAGVKILGENYAEEGVGKITSLGNDTGVEWHMIGHVQSRKVNLVVPYFSFLQSLDSLKLARKLDQALRDSGKKMPVLLEFNIGGEMNKFGWQAQDPVKWKDFLPEIEQIIKLPQINVQGLMTMPPFTIDAKKAHGYFKQLRSLRDFLEKQLAGVKLQELSMGTSSDYEIAVEEGATYIRIGQAILGERLRK